YNGISLRNDNVMEEYEIARQPSRPLHQEPAGIHQMVRDSDIAPMPGHLRRLTQNRSYITKQRPEHQSPASSVSSGVSYQSSYSAASNSERLQNVSPEVWSTSKHIPRPIVINGIGNIYKQRLSMVATTTPESWHQHLGGRSVSLQDTADIHKLVTRLDDSYI
ncbi:unnamed protein product, partial [Meganyctiphanes norvegica]